MWSAQAFDPSIRHFFSSPMPSKLPHQTTSDPDDPETETSREPRGSTPSLSGGAFYAQTVFDRHGVPHSERSRLVERILQLAYSAAHRRVRGKASWTIEELQALAAHFGETLDEVFIAAAKTRGDAATLVAGDLRLKCQLWVGAETRQPAQGGLVATREGGRWTVVAASEDITGPMYEIRQLLMEPDAAYGSRVAVLGDDAAVTDPLCAFLRQAGFRADAFHAIAPLQDALDAQPYDGYVFDWSVGGQTVAALVERIRATDPRCPIAIFTGRNERGDVVSDIADMMARHDVRHFSKPLDPHLITAVLKRLIAVHARP
jgi:CheY-like chemotaxis protein